MRSSKTWRGRASHTHDLLKLSSQWRYKWVHILDIQDEGQSICCCELHFCIVDFFKFFVVIVQDLAIDSENLLDSVFLTQLVFIDIVHIFSHQNVWDILLDVTLPDLDALENYQSTSLVSRILERWVLREN